MTLTVFTWLNAAPLIVATLELDCEGARFTKKLRYRVV